MPYEFRQWDDEMETAPSSARLGGPPRKATRIGVLDPPGPPNRPPGRLAGLPASLPKRLLAGLILAGLGLFVFFELFAR